MSFFSTSTRPRSIGASGLSGCFFSSASMAFSALSTSFLRRWALTSARSASAPLSLPAMFSSSVIALSVLPLPNWLSASAVRMRGSSGLSLDARS